MPRPVTFLDTTIYLHNSLWFATLASALSNTDGFLLPTTAYTHARLLTLR